MAMGWRWRSGKCKVTTKGKIEADREVGDACRGKWKTARKARKFILVLPRMKLELSKRLGELMMGHGLMGTNELVIEVKGNKRSLFPDGEGGMRGIFRSRREGKVFEE